MVATNRHHGLPALPDSKDGLQGALFNLWTPDPRHKHHHANTTHLDATSPKAGPGRCWGFVQLGPAQRGPGVVGGEGGGWEGGVVGGGGYPGPLRRPPPRRSRQAPPPAPSNPPSSPGWPRPPTSPSSRSPSSACCSSWAACTSWRSARGTMSMRSRRSTSPCPALPPRVGGPRCGTW